MLELIAQQHRGALGVLYDRYAGALYSLAMHMLRDSGAAEEVTQDVFFNVWRRASSYNAKRGSLTAWLFSIAHHRTIDELRRRRREQTKVQSGVDLSNKPSDGSDDPLNHATSQYERGRLKDALHTLRPEQREVVVLAYFWRLNSFGNSQTFGTTPWHGENKDATGVKKTQGSPGPSDPGVGGSWTVTKSRNC